MVIRRLLYARFVCDEVRQTLPEVRQRRADEAADRLKAKELGVCMFHTVAKRNCGRGQSHFIQLLTVHRSGKEPSRPPRSRPVATAYKGSRSARSSELVDSSNRTVPFNQLHLHTFIESTSIHGTKSFSTRFSTMAWLHLCSCGRST